MRNKLEIIVFLLAILGSSFIGLNKILTIIGFMLMVPFGAYMAWQDMKNALVPN